MHLHSFLKNPLFENSLIHDCNQNSGNLSNTRAKQSRKREGLRPYGLLPCLAKPIGFHPFSDKMKQTRSRGIGRPT